MYTHTYIGIDIPYYILHITTYYIYIYIHMHIYIYTHIHIHIYIYTYTYVTWNIHKYIRSRIFHIFNGKTAVNHEITQCMHRLTSQSQNIPNIHEPSALPIFLNENHSLRINLGDLRAKITLKIIIGQTNMNSVREKFEPCLIINQGNTDVLI